MDKLRNTKKTYLLIAGTILLLLISYELAFKKTVSAWQLHRQLQQQLTAATDMSTAPDYLFRKNKNLDQLIKSYRLDSVTFRNNVVNTIAGLAEQEQVKFTIIPADDPLYHPPRFIIQKLDFEGDFFSLLKLVNSLQTASGVGILRSVSLKTKKLIPGDDRSKKLNLEIYMEICR